MPALSARLIGHRFPARVFTYVCDRPILEQLEPLSEAVHLSELIAADTSAAYT